MMMHAKLIATEYLPKQRVRPAKPVEHGHHGDVAVVAGMNHVELHGEPLPADGVLGGRVPVHLLQPVHLPVDAHAPSSVVVEAQLHPSTKF